MKKKIDVDEIYPQLTRVETTTGSNGYPQNLSYVYYCDSRNEMKEIISELVAEGYEVNELFLRRRNGQQLWNRDNCIHNNVNLGHASEQDWYMHLDMNDTEENLRDTIFDFLIGDDEDYIEDIGRKEVKRRVDSFYDEISCCKGEGSTYIFYSPDQDNRVDYVITEDCTGYHDGDVTSYQMAFEVIEKD